MDLEINKTDDNIVYMLISEKFSTEDHRIDLEEGDTITEEEYNQLSVFEQGFFKKIILRGYL